MNLETEKYIKQKTIWPQEGKCVLAQYDDNSIIVYQAYRPSIGNAAVKNQSFGDGGFSFTRMSWIKTNFLWMMYRSGWGTKDGQEVTLAIRLKRRFFDEILLNAFSSSNKNKLPKDEWDKIISGSDVRLQWDPDHAPNGDKEERRAVQLGLRNSFLKPFKGDGILEITDISEFVNEQRKILGKGLLEELITPKERVYPVSTEQMKALGM